MTKVFESPDGGHTVYQRDHGKSERQLIWESLEKKDLVKELEEDKLWGDIRRAAKNNYTLQKELERVIILYRLIKDKNEQS